MATATDLRGFFKFAKVARHRESSCVKGREIRQFCNLVICAHRSEEAARLFFKPKWLWPAPLLEVAPRRLVHELRKALLNYTDRSWWCQARFWADRIDIHPVYGAAVNSALAALRLGVPVSAIARTALSTHLRELGLCIASWDQRGLFLSPLSEDLCFRKTLRPYFSHRRANKPATCAAPGGTLYRCLQETKLTRYDSESINDVDVDASSQPYWATWRKRLDARQMLLLTIYRGAQQALLPGDKRCLRTARDAPSATGLRPRCGTSGLNALLLSLRGKTS